MSLPIGYKRLEYIQSSGTQYIDTGFKPSGNALRIVIKFRYTTSHDGLTMFGNHNTKPYSISPYGARPTFWVGTTDNISCGPQTSLDTNYILDVTANNGSLTAIWNGEQYEASYSGSLHTGHKMFIFGSSSNGAITETGNGYRLFSFQMHDNGTLVRDFVPCQTTAGEIGLWDDVNSVFYGNAGTGTFTAGPVVASPSIFVNIDGIWKPINHIYVNINNIWQKST